MEISLRDRICAINPRRILYIEYCRREVYGGVYPRLDLTSIEQEEGRINPRDKTPGTEGFYNRITIYLTDNQHISYEVEENVDADAEFEKLKSELSRVVGG
jgi:hypothetical protein